MPKLIRDDESARLRWRAVIGPEWTDAVPDEHATDFSVI
jgi:hypothetical protein